jgi:hypothetical protein
MPVCCVGLHTSEIDTDIHAMTSRIVVFANAQHTGSCRWHNRSGKTLNVCFSSIVADIDSESWQCRCFVLQEIVRGEESLPSMLVGKNNEVRETRAKRGINEAMLRELPSNLRFSILSANPHAEVVETKQDMTEEEKVDVAIKSCARALCEDVI